MLENTEIYSAFNKFCNSYSGIYPNSFNNVRFGTKIELLNILFHENLSQNYCKVWEGVWRGCKLSNRFMAKPWWGVRGIQAICFKIKSYED